MTGGEVRGTHPCHGVGEALLTSGQSEVHGRACLFIPSAEAAFIAGLSDRQMPRVVDERLLPEPGCPVVWCWARWRRASGWIDFRTPTLFRQKPTSNRPRFLPPCTLEEVHPARRPI